MSDLNRRPDDYKFNIAMFAGVRTCAFVIAKNACKINGYSLTCANM